MLSVNQTMDSISKQLQLNLKQYRDIREIFRNDQTLVLSASCIELDRSSLGRVFVKKIRAFNLANKPTRVGFTSTPPFKELFCDATEILIVCIWDPCNL